MSRIDSKARTALHQNTSGRSQGRLLFVTTRNLGPSIGEWRLIANRSAALQSEFGICTDILYLRPAPCAPAQLDGRQWFQDFRFLQFSNYPTPRMFMTLRELRKSVKLWLAANAGGYIVISGAQLYFTPLGIPEERLIVDLHGTLREWIEGIGTARRDLTLRFAYPFAAMAEKRLLRKAWGAFSVSNELAEYARDCGVSRVWRIPCGLSMESVSPDRESTRKEWRTRFSIPADSTVFVYSGGLSKWQCVREALRLFEGMQQIVPGMCRLLVITPHVEALQKLLTGVDRSGIVTCSVAPGEVGAALSAGDIGLMLREDTSTNHNAFPNKLAEYLAAGLFVITSPGLRDPAQMVTKNQLGTLIDPDEVRRGLTRERLIALLDAYHARGDRSRYFARAEKVIREELSMERLVAPFAESVIAR